MCKFRFTKPILAFVILMAETFMFIGCAAENQPDKDLIASFSAGAEYCPDKIASIKAPFEMSQLQRPIFKDKEVILNLKTNCDASVNREIIQNAIDKLSSKGGGRVTVPDGTWLTGRIELYSDIDFHLSDNAILEFSGDIKDYLPVVFTRDEGVELYSLGACIYANSAENIAVTGKGHIVGPSTDCEIYTHCAGDAETNLGLFSLNDTVELHPVPVEERVFDGGNDGVYLPKTIAPINCTNVLVEGVTLDHCLYWNVVPQYCENVIIRGVTVNSYGHGRTDGVDVESSKNVLVEYCTLDCQDDCFTMKSGRGLDAVRVHKPTENVVVRNCLTLRGAGGIVLGSETGGGMENIYCTDCEFRGTDQGISFKTRRSRFGVCSHVYVENIRMKDLNYTMFKVDMLGSSTYVGKLANRYPAPEWNILTPGYEHIYINNVWADGCKAFLNIKGLPESPVTDVHISNVKVKCQSFGSLQDVKDFYLNGVEICTNDSALKVDSECQPVLEDVTINGLP